MVTLHSAGYYPETFEQDMVTLHSAGYYLETDALSQQDKKLMTKTLNN